jgi:murein tripeptide amidase MpaA
MKAKSLYNQGMRIAVYSDKKSELENIGWHRGGTEIDYYRNGLYRITKNGRRQLFSSLTFKYKFEYDDDCVYFANSIPYTYTQLNNELNEFEKDEIKYHYLTRKTICSTLAGNNLDVLTIANKNRNEDISNRPGIVIMARVHPGETVGSFMMNGVISFLTSNDTDAEYIRDNYVVKVIPMMNPDGVITGNYR